MRVAQDRAHLVVDAPPRVRRERTHVAAAEADGVAVPPLRHHAHREVARDPEVGLGARRHRRRSDGEPLGGAATHRDVELGEYGVT